MKTVCLMLALAFAAIPVMAEQPGNPDRFPSIGVQFAGDGTSGTSKVFSGSSAVSQDITTSNGALLLDVRFPVSQYMTLTGGVGFVGSGVKATETPALYGQDMKTNGTSFNVGVRFYIH